MVGGAGLLRRDQNGCCVRKRLRNAALEFRMIFSSIELIPKYSEQIHQRRAAASFTKAGLNKALGLSAARILRSKQCLP